MDYEKIKQKDLGKEVKFKFSKKAFKANKLYCDCDTKLHKTIIHMEIPDSPLIMRLEVFKCPKCGKEHMNGEQAKKMDKLLLINKLITDKKLILERNVNYNSGNYIVRLPSQYLKGIGKKAKANIIPLSVEDYLISIKR